MAYSSSTEQQGIFERFSKAYAYVPLAMLPVGVLLALGMGTPGLARRGLALTAVPAIGAFLILRSREESTGFHSLVYSLHDRTLQAAFLVAFNVSIIILTLGAYRPWYYFGVVVLLYVLVLLQIVSGARAWTIVAQLSGIMLSWTYGLTLKYGLFFGGTSTFMHRFYAEITASSGGLVPADLTSYTLFPLYHTFVAGAANLLGVSVTTVIAGIVPIPFVVTIGLVYALARGIANDEQIGKLTALLYSLLPSVLYASPYVITRTMAFVGFVALLYVAYSRHRFSKIQYGVLLGAFVGYISLVHHVSTPQFLSLLVLLAAFERLVTDHRFVGIPLIALGVSTVIYWGTIASQFTHRIVETFLAPGQYSSPDVVGSATESSRHLTYYFQNNVLIFLVLVGIGILLWHHSGRYGAVFGLFALCTFVLYIPSPIHLIGQTVNLLRMDRYMLFLSPFVAFAMAIGLYGLQDELRSLSVARRPAVRIGVVVLLVCIFAASSLTAASTAPNAADSEDLSWTGPPVHLTDDELQGMEFVPSNVPPDSRVAGDWQTARFYRPYAYDFRGADEHDVPIYERETIGSVGDVYAYEGYLVVRTEVFDDGKLLLGGAGKGQRASFGNEEAMAEAIGNADVIYANDGVRIYRTNEHSQPASSG